MDLELHFGADARLMSGAIADIWVRDLALADGPLERTSGKHSASVALDDVPPSTRVSVLVPVAEDVSEPALVVRVRGRGPDGSAIQFVNTTATPLPRELQGPVAVQLHRID